MTPLNPCEGAREIIGILIGVARPGDGIPDGSIASHLDEWRPDGLCQGRCVLEAKARRSRVIQMLVDQEFVAQEREAQRSHKRGCERVCRLRNEILPALILPTQETRDVVSTRR